MSVLKIVKRDEEGTHGQWVLGCDLRFSNTDYLELLQEKQEEIDRLEKEVAFQKRVIDSQRQTLKEFNRRKSIVADWLETPIAHRK